MQTAVRATHGALSPEFRAVSSLGRAERAAMRGLYLAYYEGTSGDRFDADLEAKDTVLLLADGDGVLQGFSTLAVWTADHRGQPVRVLYSGDTIIARAWWGTQALPVNWITYAGKLKAQYPLLPLYWFLIVKGHRTYRFLPTFANTFHPDWRQPESPELKGLLDALAARQFGHAYHRAGGVIRFDTSHGHLGAEWAAISAREAARPDVAFFLTRNPGYARGDELACLCELSEENLKPIARRWFAQGLSGHF